MAQRSVADTLREAAAVILRRGMWQLAVSSEPGSPDAPVCAWGALWVAVSRDERVGLGGCNPGHPLVGPCLKALALPPHPQWPATPVSALTYWGDRSGRTLDEVVALFARGALAAGDETVEVPDGE